MSDGRAALADLGPALDGKIEHHERTGREFSSNCGGVAIELPICEEQYQSLQTRIVPDQQDMPDRIVDPLQPRQQIARCGLVDRFIIDDRQPRQVQFIQGQFGGLARSKRG